MRRKRKIRKVNIVVKYCEYCGAKFYANRSTAKYCSDTCRVYAYLERKEKLQRKYEPTIRKDIIENDSKKRAELESADSVQAKELHNPKTVIDETVPTDTEKDLWTLLEKIRNAVSTETSGHLLSQLHTNEICEKMIRDYEKRFNTTLPDSKKRFPNVKP